MSGPPAPPPPLDLRVFLVKGGTTLRLYDLIVQFDHRIKGKDLASRIKPPVDSDAVSSKAVVVRFFIRCLLLLPWFVDPCFVVLHFVSFLV